MTDTDSQKPAKQVGKEPRPWTVYWGVILLLIGVLVIGCAVGVSALREGGLSPFEQLLFSVLTLVLSTGGSILMAEHYARKQGIREYQQLARPALRRVVELQGSVDGIQRYLLDRRGLFASEQPPAPEVVQEWLDGALALLEQHGGQLRASVADWQELLPSDYQHLQSLLQAEAQYEAQIASLQAQQATLAANLAAREEKDADAEMRTRGEIAALQEQIAGLKVKQTMLTHDTYDPISKTLTRKRRPTGGSGATSLSDVAALLTELNNTNQASEVGELLSQLQYKPARDTPNDGQA